MMNAPNNWGGAWDPGRKPDPPKEIVKELFAAPVEAYRVWAIHRAEALSLTKSLAEEMAAAFDAGRNPFVGLFSPKLSGIGHAVPWESATHTAKCSAQNTFFNLALSASPSVAMNSGGATHEAPQPYCTCGVWAVKDEATMRSTLAEYRAAGKLLAFGKVQMWGRIYEHKRGYRAQFARPLEITIAGGDDTLAAELAAFYGCPVVAGKLPEVPKPDPAQMQYGTPGQIIQMTSGSYVSYQSQMSAYQSALRQQNNALSRMVLFGSAPSPNRERTHGTPSSFLECSRRWAGQYGPSTVQRRRGWAARLFSRAGTALTSPVPCVVCLDVRGEARGRGES